MAPFPYMPMLAIMISLVSYLVVQISVFAYAGYMVEHLGVVDDKDKAGETRLRRNSMKLYSDGLRRRLFTAKCVRA